MRIFAMLALVAVLSGCAVSSPFEASPEEVAAKAYVPEGPPKLTIFTMVNNTTGAGGHTALMVSGSQQVIFDPAGSFQHQLVAERGDVLYGISPAWVQAYKSAHARNSHHVVTQEIVVTPEQAEIALQLVRQNGAVPGAFCTRSTTAILKQVPGFADIEPTFYPVKLMDQIAARPGVVMDRYYEDDEGNVRDGIVPVEG